MSTNSHLPNEWFNKGDHSLSDAILLFKDGGYTDTICYLCHQTIEKYLKGYLILKKKQYPKIHNLTILLDRCVEIDKEFSSFFNKINFLNQFYIETKYPMSPPKMPTHKDAKECIEVTEKIIKFIIK